MSPSANTSGWPGSVRSGSTATLPARSSSAPVSSPRRVASRDAETPAAQMTVRAGMRSVPPGVSTATDSRSIATTLRSSIGVTPSSSSERAALPRERWRKAGQDPIRRLDQQHTARARVDGPKVVPQSVAGELGDLPRHLDPGRPGADDDEGEPLPPPLLVRLQLRRLEGAQQPCPHRERALQRLDLRRHLPPFVVAEVRAVRSAGDDQRVEGRDRARVAGERIESHLAGAEVEVLDLRHQHADVSAPLEDRAQRIAKTSPAERTGRHLVGERLKEMEIAPVDQRQLDGRARQVLRGLEPAEAPADDHDLVRHVVLTLARLGRLAGGG